MNLYLVERLGPVGLVDAAFVCAAESEEEARGMHPDDDLCGSWPVADVSTLSVTYLGRSELMGDSRIVLASSEHKARTLAAQIVAQLRVIDGWHP